MSPPQFLAARAPDGLPCLAEHDVARALVWLETPRAEPGAAALRALLRAWRYASPFHNLDLLAGLVDVPPPLTAEDAVRRALSGLGGPCHVQATGFAVLLGALGYDAALMPATVKAPDDHLVVGVEIAGTRVFCDVGNGHPYPGPFPVDKAAESEWFGWRFRSTPVANGIALERTAPDRERRHVYVARWERRSYDAFYASITAHHTQAEFGPFMTGLRAVRITPRGMLCLRDTRYERHTPFGVLARPVLDREAMHRLLSGPFGLGKAPVEAALRGLAQRRPELFTSAGNSLASEHPQERLTCLVACATTDRPRSLQRLLRSLIATLESTHSANTVLRGRVEMLILENSVDAEHRALNQKIVGQAVHDGLPIWLVDDGCYGRSIAQSRTRQTEAIAYHAAARERPAVVWMIDDDTVFATLVLQDGVLQERPHRTVFADILELRAQHPEVSVLLGSVVGDPHVRPEAVFRTQTFDLVENLAWFSAQRPNDPYRAPAAGDLFEQHDYYYDHSRSGTAHLHRVAPWLPRAHAGTVRVELARYLDACCGIALGRAATRPLLSVPESSTRLTPTDLPLRGGNAIFFDFDACLGHPYPTATVGDVQTRRGDMIGCTLLARTGVAVATAPVTLLHERLDSSALESVSARWRSLRSEFHGVLLARLAMDGCPLGVDPEKHLHALAMERAEIIVDALAAARRQLARLDEAHAASPTWWRDDASIWAGLETLRRTMHVTWAAMVPGREGEAPETRLATLRDALLEPNDLSAVLSAWRELPHAVASAAKRMETIFREKQGPKAGW